MPQYFQWLLIAAHFSVYGVTAVSVWIFSYHSHFYKTVVKLRSLPFIYWGYSAIAIGSSYEIAEHISDNWIYVSRLSELNQLFYAFISGGVCLIALGLKRSRITDIVLIATIVLVPAVYGVQGSKGFMQLAQIPGLIVFVMHWYQVMRDWRVFLYPLFANVAAIALGIALITTGNQIFHVLIGPVSAIGLLALGYVAWIKPSRAT